MLACFRRQSNMDANGCTAGKRTMLDGEFPRFERKFDALRKNIICRNRSIVPVIRPSVLLQFY